MAYNKGNQGNRGGGRSQSSGGGGGSHPKGSLVLLPIEISGEEIKVRAKLYNSVRDRLLQFSMNGVITIDAVKETAGMETEYIFSVPPNTLEASLKAETLDGEPVLLKEIKVKTDKPAKEPVIGQAIQLKLLGKDASGKTFKIVVSRTDDKGMGIEGEVIVRDITFRKSQSNDKGIVVIAFAFGKKEKRTATVILPEKPDQILEIEIPARPIPLTVPTVATAPADTCDTATPDEKPKEKFSDRFKTAYKKGRGK